jgi:hypothetical protein
VREVCLRSQAAGEARAVTAPLARALPPAHAACDEPNELLCREAHAFTRLILLSPTGRRRPSPALGTAASGRRRPPAPTCFCRPEPEPLVTEIGLESSE